MEGITGIKSCRNFNIKEIENTVVGEEMASKTSDAKRYAIKIGHVNLTVIDTPGFGDTRGPNVDKENFEKI
jgi:hypothetical protein